MKPTLFLLGPSDREAQNPSKKEWVDGVGWKVTADFSGVLPILPFVMGDRIMSANSKMVLVGVEKSQLSKHSRVNLFNLVGDADASTNLLRKVNIMANEIRPLRIFNAPRSVYVTSRASLPTTLANIPGCIVPQTEAADPKTFGDLQAACRNFNHWPVIVRARGYHGGEHMVLLTEESQLESLKDISWPYDGIFLIQFVDYRNEEGLYHKIRVVMVDGVPYARQCVYSDKWVIHSGSRADLMDQDIELCHREENFLAQLRDKGLKEHGSLFQEIYQRIGLDVFGIDFALVNGQVVVFEANACMRFLGRGGESDFGRGRYGYMGRYKKELKRALKKMLVRA